MDYGNWIALLAIFANLIISIIKRRKAHPEDEWAQFDQIPLTKGRWFREEIPEPSGESLSQVEFELLENPTKLKTTLGYFFLIVGY